MVRPQRSKGEERPTWHYTERRDDPPPAPARPTDSGGRDHACVAGEIEGRDVEPEVPIPRRPIGRKRPRVVPIIWRCGTWPAVGRRRRKAKVPDGDLE